MAESRTIDDFKRAIANTSRWLPFGMTIERLGPLAAAVRDWVAVYHENAAFQAAGTDPEPWKVYQAVHDDKQVVSLFGKPPASSFADPHDALVDVLLKAIADACDSTRYRRWTIQERKAAGCRTCSECNGQEHHWIEYFDPVYDTAYTCKHCQAVGNECPHCVGQGCNDCEGHGVLAAKVVAT